MNLLHQSAFFEALGWSLIDSLWQVGLLWCAYSIVTVNSQRFSSAARHNLAVLASVAGTTWFFITIFINYQHLVDGREAFSLSYFFRNSLSDAYFNWNKIQASVPFLSFLYLFTILIFSIKLLITNRQNKTIYKNNLQSAGDDVIKLFEGLVKKTGITKKVRFWLSATVESPLTIGFLKPIILMPVAALNQLTTAQVEAVIAHELFHIRRNDYLLNLLMVISGVILFFNPFARLLLIIVRKERENSCDDKVLSLGYDAFTYSEALYILGRYRSNEYALAMAATGKAKEFLLARIKRVLNRKDASPVIIKPVFTFFLCLLVAVFSGRKANVPLLPASFVVVNLPKQVVHQPEIQTNIPSSVQRVKEENKIASNKPKKTDAPNQIVILETEIQDAPLPPDYPSYVEEDDEATMIYIDNEDVLEFTIIDAPKVEVTPPVNSEKALPYVPGSTFYIPQIDSTKLPGRVIRL